MTTQTYAATFGVLAIALVLAMGAVSAAYAAPGGNGNGNGNGAQNGNGGNSGNNGNGSGGNNNEPVCPEQSQAPQCQEEEVPPEEEEEPEVPVQTFTITVESQYTTGDFLTGMWTTLVYNGTTVATGYTPTEFTVEAGKDYQITVANFGNIKFSHWEDGSTSDLTWGARRNVTAINGDVTVKAFYTMPSNGNRMYEFAYKIANSLQQMGGDVPESTTGQLLYHVGHGARLFTSQMGADFSGIGWNNLTEGQQVWMIENWGALVEGL